MPDTGLSSESDEEIVVMPTKKRTLETVKNSKYIV